MADDDLLDGDDWNPFEVIEESREKLEELGALRREVKDFPAHLLTSDPAWAREIVQRSKAEKQAEKDEKATVVVPAPEVPARLAEPGEWPRAAKTLAKKVQPPEWMHAGWFMRGPVISGARVLGIRNAFVLEADHADGLRKIRVIWHEKEEGGKHERKADWVFFRGHTVPWLQAVSVKALEAYVAGEYL